MTPGGERSLSGDPVERRRAELQRELDQLARPGSAPQQMTSQAHSEPSTQQSHRQPIYASQPQHHIQISSHNSSQAPAFSDSNGYSQGHTPNPPSTHFVPAPNSAMGPALLDKLNRMRPQPSFTTTVSSRQPAMAQGGKGSKKSANRSDGKKPRIITIGSKDNSNRIYYIPITQWLSAGVQVFSSNAAVATGQANWLVRHGLGKTIEIYDGDGPAEIDTAIRRAFGPESPVDDFLFVKHGPGARYLATGDSRTLESLLNGGVSLEHFFKSCRTCYIFDAAYEVITDEQQDAEQQWIERWTAMTEAISSQLEKGTEVDLDSLPRPPATPSIQECPRCHRNIDGSVLQWHIGRCIGSASVPPSEFDRTCTSTSASDFLQDPPTNPHYQQDDMEGSPELSLNFHNDRAQVMPLKPDTQVVPALQQTDTSRRLASEIEHVQLVRSPPTAGAGALPYSVPYSDPASVTTPSEPGPSLRNNVPPAEAGVGRESLLEGLRRLIKEELTLLHQLGVPMITQTVRVKEEKDGPDVKPKLEHLDALAPPREKVNLGEIDLTDIIDSDDEVEDLPQPEHTVGPSSKGKAKASEGLSTPKEVVPSVGPSVNRSRKRKNPPEDAISPSSESTPENDDDGEQVQALGGEGDGPIFTATAADRVKNGRRKTTSRADDQSAVSGPSGTPIPPNPEPKLPVKRGRKR